MALSVVMKLWKHIFRRFIRIDFALQAYSEKQRYKHDEKIFEWEEKHCPIQFIFDPVERLIWWMDSKKYSKFRCRFCKATGWQKQICENRERYEKNHKKERDV